jgi:hypothetical protein
MILRLCVLGFIFCKFQGLETSAIGRLKVNSDLSLGELGLKASNSANEWTQHGRGAERNTSIYDEAIHSIEGISDILLIAAYEEKSVTTTK